MTQPPLVIFGNGSMARVVYSHIRRTRDVVGFTVDDTLISPEGIKFCDKPLVPFSQAADRFDPSVHDMLIAVGFIDMNALRVARAETALEMGYRLASYTDPSVTLHDDVEIGKNTIVLEHSTLHPGTRVGDHVFIGGQVGVGHDCHIGDGAWINSGVSLGGGCRIGPGCVFGVNASAAHDVVLGARAFVGANTLVNRSVAADSVTLSPAGEPFRMNSTNFLSFARMQA